MWFYRVDFDNYYTTRLVIPLLNTSGRTKSTTSATGISNLSSSLSGTSSKDNSIHNVSKLLSPITPVRGIGLPAAASQVTSALFFINQNVALPNVAKYTAHPIFFNI